MSKELISQEAKDNLAMKLREQAMGLIPTDVFSEMLDKEINEFFHVPISLDVNKTPRGWQSDEKGNVKWVVTPFRQLVWTELANLVHNQMSITIKEALDGDIRMEVVNKWDAPESKEDIKELRYNMQSVLQEMAPQIISSLFASSMGMVNQQTMQFIMTNIQDNINQGMYNSGMQQINFNGGSY